jgi:glycogen operon protein
MTDEDWNTGLTRTLGVFLNGKAIPTPDSRGEPVVDDSFYILFNAHQEAVDFKLPISPWGERWTKVIDTGRLIPDLREQHQLRAGEAVPVEGHSMMVLRRVD